MINRLIRDDIARIAGASVRGPALLKYALLNAPARCAVMHRLAAAAPAPFGRLIATLNLTLHGADIDPRASIGGGLLLQHPAGVVIGGGVTMGENCTLMSGVVLGRKNVESGDDADGYPTVGDNVLFGASSLVLGRVRIGANARIGAQGLVLRNVPAGATAIGSPAVVREPTRDA